MQDLKDKIEALAESLTSGEKACLKVLLANAIAETIDPELLSADTIEAKAYQTCVASINRLQGHKDKIPYNGVVYRGRPDFITSGLLEQLQSESESVKHTAIRFHDHYVLSGAPFASSVACMPQLKELIQQKIGNVEPTGKANYIYYDRVGLGIEPHIDNEDFSLNVILMLKHTHGEARSALVLYPFNRPPEKIYLMPGEFIVFFADSIVHARERMSEGEEVRIVAFGFKPL